MEILAVVIALLLAERAWSQHIHLALTRRYLNMIAAGNTHELALLNKIDDTPPRTPKGSEEREISHPIGA